MKIKINLSKVGVAQLLYPQGGGLEKDTKLWQLFRCRWYRVTLG